MGAKARLMIKIYSNHGHKSQILVRLIGQNLLASVAFTLLVDVVLQKPTKSLAYGLVFLLLVVASQLLHEAAHYVAAHLLDARPALIFTNRLSVLSSPLRAHDAMIIASVGPVAGVIVSAIALAALSHGARDL